MPLSVAFATRPIKLKRAIDGQLVDATARVATMDDAERWRTSWLPSLGASPAARFPWPTEIARAAIEDGCLVVVVESDTGIEGLMSVSTTRERSRAAGEPLVYVEWLASAPWNDPDIVRTPRHTRTGPALLVIATDLSRCLGFLGRVGLNSLPAAEEFYRNRMRPPLREFPPEPQEDGTMLAYFEGDTDWAEALLGMALR